MSEVVTVPAAEHMDRDTFLKHINARHLDDFRSRIDIKDDMAYKRLEPMYRAYHKRIHELALKGQFDHQHLGEWE